MTLTRTGAPSINATVRGGTVLTATAGLTTGTPGAWTIVVRPAGGRVATLGGAFTVTAAPLKVTRGPAVSGAVRVGGTVRAGTGTWNPTPTAYAYQWTANGAVIKGATGSAYVIPASLRGARPAVIVTAWRPNRAVSTAVTVGYGVTPVNRGSPATPTAGRCPAP
ncbi:hypothetical protein [Actinoplanes utahensis]|uniref:Uncharacterized protein n=1 Tax=Actinoplanes utahensis TaxID=1869 RepID=A0A0A6WXF8_ACTUT|nr:hypothetical protein [Actinoplanes utahensis]KHD72367.1 hypothetical protein MB27_38465 [Actinoplanes utahensis]GIF29559.1 hypothetical protein Aut01nite_25450 [Actinoplanes utahensis]